MNNAKQIAEYWLTKVNAYGEMGALGEQSDEAVIARAYLQLLAKSPRRECPYCNGAYRMRETQEHEERDGKILVGIFECTRCNSRMIVPFD